MCKSVMATQDGFIEAVFCEVAALSCIITPPNVTFDDGVLQSLQNSVESVKNPAHLTSTLLKFPQHGKVLIDAAQTRLQLFSQQTSWQAEIEAGTLILHDVGLRPGTLLEIRDNAALVDRVLAKFETAPEQLKSAYSSSTMMAERAVAELEVVSYCNIA